MHLSSTLTILLSYLGAHTGYAVCFKYRHLRTESMRTSIQVTMQVSVLDIFGFEVFQTNHFEQVAYCLLPLSHPLFIGLSTGTDRAARSSSSASTLQTRSFSCTSIISTSCSSASSTLVRASSLLVRIVKKSNRWLRNYLPNYSNVRRV